MKSNIIYAKLMLLLCISLAILFIFSGCSNNQSKIKHDRASTRLSSTSKIKNNNESSQSPSSSQSKKVFSPAQNSISPSQNPPSSQSTDDSGQIRHPVQSNRNIPLYFNKQKGEFIVEKVDKSWIKRYPNINISNQWIQNYADNYHVIVIFGSLKSDVKQGVAISVCLSGGKITLESQFFQPDKGGSVKATEIGGAKPFTVLTLDESGNKWNFNCYSGFNQKY
ncbi:MAG: hypothetical protein Q8934_08120 [Bacillota bacterium]|nr:hypothetical protein [Bacillota bacterium]